MYSIPNNNQDVKNASSVFYDFVRWFVGGVQ
jgi:hypothetical protein